MARKILLAERVRRTDKITAHVRNAYTVIELVTVVAFAIVPAFDASDTMFGARVGWALLIARPDADLVVTVFAIARTKDEIKVRKSSAFGTPLTRRHNWRTTLCTFRLVWNNLGKGSHSIDLGHKHRCTDLSCSHGHN